VGRGAIENKDCQTQVEAIHDFWFGPLDSNGFPSAEKHQLWFRVSPETDATIRVRFESLVLDAMAGKLDHWAEGDAGLIALVLLLDQFTRNIYRGSAAAFSGDSKALGLARKTIHARRDRSLPVIHRVFLYMPLEHAEDIEAQEQCVGLFSDLTADSDAQMLQQFRRFAVAHRDVIRQYGRFPHRNDVLGRDCSEEELAYLEQHGGF
jgi:uncharacterized protein (DUF924 family)